MAASRWGALALALSLSMPASARDAVTWYLDPTFPPAHIGTGRYAGTGILDSELNWLIARLPQFDHVVVESNAARYWNEVGHGDGRCSPAALKTPKREKMALFSAPAVMVWGVMLMVRNDRLPELREMHGPSGDFDFAKVIRQETLQGVANVGRSYGVTIDPLLTSPEGRRAVHVVSNTLQGLRMVTSGRADYAIGYSTELGYFRKIDGSSEPITILPIEGVNRYSYGFVACSDQPVGRAAIAAINEVLAHEGAPPPYMREAQQWLNDKEFGEIMAPALWSAGDGGRYRD